MPSWRIRLIKVLPWITGTLVLVQLLSLRLGLLDRFFYDSMHAARSTQGIDYYSLPKAFLNLAAGQSAYDTFAPPAYGDHATWYLAHPALAVLAGSWLSRVDPATSYGIFVFVSLAIMAACAWVIAQNSSDALVRRLIWLLLLCAFPTYWTLYTGNVQPLLVLAVGMVFSGLYQLAFMSQEPGRRAETLLLAGLLLSLLTKPVVLLMLPLLLLLGETRRPAFRALCIYAAVSVLFEIVPALNPAGVGLPRVAWLAIHPGFVRATMNIYANNFVVTPDMKDNSIHWFNLIAQSDYRLHHVDIFSLPDFMDTVLSTRTPGWLYQIPLLIVLALTLAVARIRDKAVRMQSALLLTMAISLVFFLGYPTVWEYQYTGVLPIAAILWLMLNRTQASERLWPRVSEIWMLALATCAWLPSLYFLTEGREVDATVMTVIRLDRVVPTALLFLLMIAVLIRTVVSPPKAKRTASESL